MAYDDKLADRVRTVLKRRRGVTEKKMFGGLAFLLNGNMCCGVIRKDLVLRLGEDGAAKALDKPYAREMDFTGKPLKTMVYIGRAGYRTEAQLRHWVTQGVDYAKSVPAK
jgi:TfoX/Sxy family transcriptional regulator of competence genes